MYKVIFLSCVLFLLISPASAQVVINEVSPISNPEWVEFHNASSSADYIKSYYIDDDTSFSDDAGSSSKRRLDELGGGVEYPTFNINSFLNNDSDRVVLFNEQGSIIDQFEYSSSPGEGFTYGRFPDKSGNFSLLAQASKGGYNAAPKSSPEPSPIPIATLKPTPKPTLLPSPTPAMKKSPVPSPKISPFPSPEEAVEEDILGLISQSSPTPLASPQVLSAKSSGNIKGLLFIVGGVLLSGIGGLVAYKKTTQE